MTAVTTASTMAPPTWNAVWNKLAARPCSRSATPLVAARLRAEKPSPNAIPTPITAGRMTPR